LTLVSGVLCKGTEQTPTDAYAHAVYCHWCSVGPSVISPPCQCEHAMESGEIIYPDGIQDRTIFKNLKPSVQNKISSGHIPRGVWSPLAMGASRSGGGSSHSQTIRMPHSHAEEPCCAFEIKIEKGWGGHHDVRVKTRLHDASSYGDDGEIQPACTMKASINFTATLYTCVRHGTSPVSTSRGASPRINWHQTLVTYPASGPRYGQMPQRPGVMLQVKWNPRIEFP